MFNATMKHLVAGAILVLAGEAGVHAQNPQWAEKMFEKTSHDFGVVARGAGRDLSIQNHQQV